MGGINLHGFGGNDGVKGYDILGLLLEAMDPGPDAIEFVDEDFPDPNQYGLAVPDPWPDDFATNIDDGGKEDKCKVWVRGQLKVTLRNELAWLKIIKGGLQLRSLSMKENMLAFLMPNMKSCEQGSVG